MIYTYNYIKIPKGINMTEKEISKLTRKELIKMLISLTEENNSLKEENEKLSKDLKFRRIAIDNSGSMAEAALKLNRVFEAADAAAKQYLQNVKAKADAQAKADAAKKAEAEAEAETEPAEEKAEEPKESEPAEAEIPAESTEEKPKKGKNKGKKA